jgi:putative lipoic acid-binding regulatory protein
MANLPYAQRTITLIKMLEKIKTASVPEKFSQDFVSEKLLMKGGTPRSIIPFIKKMGLVATDGTPTERYKEYRNPAKSGIAIAEAMRELYETLFEMNEYVQDVDQETLKGLIVEATGAEHTSTVVHKALSTFQALRKCADFDAASLDAEENVEDTVEDTVEEHAPTPTLPQIHHQGTSNSSEGINLSYTINLNLPATTDIEVFNAIFKSLKQHLIQE